jgi:phosphate transport system substrate-binding protein
MVDLGMFSRGISRAEIEKGAWWIAVTKDAVLPTINAKNPYLNQLKRQGITKDEFTQIFIQQDIRRWDQLLEAIGGNTHIHVYSRSDACGAAQMWGEFLGQNQEGLEGIGVFGDPGMADAVKNDVLAIGYNNVVYVYDTKTRKKYTGIEVAPVDLNANGKIDPGEDFYSTLDQVMEAIANDNYPSPPARDLYFVAHGKPQNQAVVTFLTWILTKGQQYVGEAGYVKLSQQKIDTELAKLK